MAESIATIPLVAKESSDWSHIEFLLSLVVPEAFEPTLKRALDLTNPHLSTNFETNNAQKQTVYCWVRCSEADNIVPLRTRGFTVPPSGKIFTAGTLTPSDLTTSAMNFYVLCRVAVGATYAVEAAAAGLEVGPTGAVRLASPQQGLSLQPLPPGYDSAIIVSESLRTRLAEIADNQPHQYDVPTSGTADDDVDLAPHERATSYVVFSSALVEPLYQVEFELIRTDQHVVRMCENCGRNPATVFCKADNAFLCAQCDVEIHSANTLMARHARVPIDLAEQSHFRFCRHHPSTLVEYFCPICQVPVCVRCKMEGNHSCGETATHRLITIAEACAQVRQKAQLVGRDMAAAVQARHDDVLRELRAVDERLREVFRNSAAVEERLFAMLNTALQELQKVTTNKLSGLLGAEADLTRGLRALQLIQKRFDAITAADPSVSPAEFIERYSAAQRCARQNLMEITHQGAAPPLESANILIRTEDGAVRITTAEETRNALLGDEEVPVAPLSSRDYADHRVAVESFRSTLYGRRRRVAARAQETPTAAAPDAGFDATDGAFASAVQAQVSYDATSAGHRLRRSHAFADSQGETGSVLDGETGQLQGLTMTQPAPLPEEVNLFTQYSLRADAETRRRRMVEKNVMLQEQPFSGSKILNQRDAQALYFALPTDSGPQTNFIWSLEEYGPSIRDMHCKIDAQGSTVIVVRLGSEIFGGFASLPWKTDSTPFGSHKCFLFSLTKDLKFYCKRGHGVVPLLADPETLSFGKDLVFAQDFERCSSLLEVNYSVGLPEDSPLRRSLLPGTDAESWRPDAVEVWNFI